MAERFDVAARRHLDSADLLEREGMLDDAGYHYGLAGETAVKQAVVVACGILPKSLKAHFDAPLRDAIARSQEVATLLTSGRLSGGLADDLRAGRFVSRFDKWSITIRYADSAFPVDAARVAAWRADALALLRGGIF